MTAAGLYREQAEMDRIAHWERIYSTKPPTEVSWYQPEPSLSLELIAAAGKGLDARVMDVGGGASVLVDRLLDRGCERVTVLDVSATALERAKARLGRRAERVSWLVGDVTELTVPEGAFDIWHDRALFHFLTEPGDRRKYAQAAVRALTPRGHVVIATFAIDGPPKCSGLDVARYSPATLQSELGPAFELRETRTEVHTTPRGVQQPFLYARFQRTGE